MKATAALGKIGNFPIRGTVVNIESADIVPLVNAGVSAVKFLVAAGAITAGIAIVAAISQARTIEEDSRIPLGSLAWVRTPKKSFIGVCLDTTLNFTHDEQPFSVELSKLRRINTDGRPRHYNITLIDGSEYHGIIPTTKHLSLFSLAGAQRVFLPYEINWPLMLWVVFPPLFPLVFKDLEKQAPSPITICGVTPRDIDDLKRRLRYAVENTRESVIAAIGENVFSHFFK